MYLLQQVTRMNKEELTGRVDLHSVGTALQHLDRSISSFHVLYFLDWCFELCSSNLVVSRHYQYLKRSRLKARLAQGPETDTLGAITLLECQHRRELPKQEISITRVRDFSNIKSNRNDLYCKPLSLSLSISLILVLSSLWPVESDLFSLTES